MSNRSRQFNKTLLTLKVGDITLESVDAVVNAANPGLLGGGGVDGAIHRAGGPAILEQCREIRRRNGPCAPGNAVVTTGGNLKASHVIHAVGPIWRGGDSAEESTLASAYRRCLELAEENRLRRLAFPSISTGAYGYPVDQAARVALAAIRDFCLRSDKLAEVTFVLFDQDTFAAYDRALSSL